jgi:hypothetical protein
MRLTGEIVQIEHLTEEQRNRCFQLLRTYYEGADLETFRRDLSEKQWVILLSDPVDGSIQGFSTQMVLERVISGIPIKALFSGDTIISRDHWGDNELAKQWFRLAEHICALYPQSRLFWFLISKGYKTYRFLPVYFKKFYPCYNSETPEFEKQIMDALGYLKYPDDYSGRDGVIHLSKDAMYLKKGVADIDEKRLKDPHVCFFVERNPLYWKGDELVCVAEFAEHNFNPCVFKMIAAVSKL